MITLPNCEGFIENDIGFLTTHSTVGPGSFRLDRAFGSGGFLLAGRVGFRCASGRAGLVSYGVPGRAGFRPPGS